MKYQSICHIFNPIFEALRRDKIPHFQYQRSYLELKC